MDNIQMIEGENLELPVSYDDSQALERYQASLKMSRDGNVLKNLFDKIQLEKSDKGGPYHLLKLDGLEAGEYQLKLRLYSH